MNLEVAKLKVTMHEHQQSADQILSKEDYKSKQIFDASFYNTVCSATDKKYWAWQSLLSCHDGLLHKDAKVQVKTAGRSGLLTLTFVNSELQWPYFQPRLFNTVHECPLGFEISTAQFAWVLL